MKLIEKLRDMLRPKCPDCGGKLNAEYIDMELDIIVYKCESCGEEFA